MSILYRVSIESFNYFNYKTITLGSGNSLGGGVRGCVQSILTVIIS